jgi:hypothetical protein
MKNKALRNHCPDWRSQKFGQYKTGHQHDDTLTLPFLNMETMQKYQILHVFPAMHIKELQIEYTCICGAYDRIHLVGIVVEPIASWTVSIFLFILLRLEVSTAVNIFIFCLAGAYQCFRGTC